MDINTAYQKTLSAARLEVKNTKRDWTIQHHKRKAERTAEEDEEIRGRWTTAKDNLKKLMASRPKDLPGFANTGFANKDVKQQEVESILNFNENSPLTVVDSDDDLGDESDIRNQDNGPSGPTASMTTGALGNTPNAAASTVQAGPPLAPGTLGNTPNAAASTVQAGPPLAPGISTGGSWVDGFFFPDPVRLSAQAGTLSKPSDVAPPISGGITPQPEASSTPQGMSDTENATHLPPHSTKHLDTADGSRTIVHTSGAMPLDSQDSDMNGLPTGSISSSHADAASVSNHMLGIESQAQPLQHSPPSHGGAPKISETQDIPSHTSADVHPDSVAISTQKSSVIAKSILGVQKVIPLQMAKKQEEVQRLTAQRQAVYDEIAARENDLCQPLQRTMDDIRSALAFIDQGYALAQDMTHGIDNLQKAIQESEEKQAEWERRKPLLDEKKRLVKERTDLAKSLVHISTDLLKERQDKIAEHDQRILDIDIQLNPTKAKASTKPTGKTGKTGKRGKSKAASVLPQAEDASDEGSDEDDDRAVMDTWNDMDADEKKAFTENVRSSIVTFIKTGKLKDFKVSHRKALREIQCLLPEYCFFSREVATAIHVTSHGNSMCHYHGLHQKMRYFDGATEFLIEGVAYQAKYGKKNTPVKAHEGYMNCGCHIDHALLEFFFWKTLSISSTRPDLASLTETMKGDAFRPRIRSFVIKLFETFTFLTVDDIFTNTRPFGKRQRELYLYNLSMNRIAEHIVQTSRGSTSSIAATGEEQEDRLGADDMTV